MTHAIQRLSFLISFMCFLLLAPAVWAQYGSSIEGVVSDQSGATVAGATVTATNQGTLVGRSTQTNDSGLYRISGLPPGTYKVVAEAASFKSETTPGVVVAAEAVRGLNISLQPGGAQESVTVTAAGEGLETENASVTGTITSQEVTDLPEFGRDPYALIRLTPGVFGDSSRQANGNSQVIPQQVGPGGSNSQIFQTENQVQAIADGQRVSANDYILDGVSVNSLEWGGAAVVTPNEESVQEITVASNTYSAQDGRNSGAQVKVISKSGTNNFHGSALIKFNDKGLNAFNKFEGPTNTTTPPSQITCEAGTSSQFKIVARQCPGRVDQRYRDYAGSVGGPIIKDKLFFFFSYEGVRLSNTSLVRAQTLETPQFEQYVVNNNPGSLAAKIFSTPGITPRIATVTSETDCCSFTPNYGLGRFYTAGAGAVGNGPDGIKDWGIFDLAEPNRSSGNQYNGRVDYTHGNNQFFVSTYIVRLNNFNGGARPIDDLTLLPNNYASTIGWSRTLGPTMLNELRVNFTRWNFDQRQPVGATNFGIPQIRIFDFDIGGFGANDSFLGLPQSSTTPGALAQNTYGLADTFSWINRQHAWKFGVEARREQNNNDQPGAERPQYQFRGLMNFANDACCFYEQVEVNPAGGTLNEQRYFRTSDYGLFAQDDWKLRPNLTLNLGVRWEYFGPLTEAHGTISNYVLASDWVVNGFVCGPAPLANRCHNGNQLYSAQHHNFGPRLGFAWSPGFSHDKLVFRGGFGIIFNRNSDAVFDNVRQDTPFSALATACCFDPGPIVAPPPGSNITYSLGSSKLANSYPVNPAFSNGVAPDGALCASAGCASVNPVSLFAALPNEPNPYVYIFSYQAQLEPLRNWVFKAGYQGSRSRKLVRTIDLNRLVPGDTFDGTQDKIKHDGPNGLPCGSTNPTCPAQGATGNNRFLNIYTPLPDVNASFDAAVLSVDRKFGHGFQLDGSYTWSHAIDTSSYEVGFQQTDPVNQAIDRGNSDFDIRQNLVIAGTWQSPFVGGRNTWMGQAVGGWSISGIFSKHTGFSFPALIGSCNTNNDRNGDGYCPDLPANFSGTGFISNPSKQQFINGIFPGCQANSSGVVTQATCPIFDITTRGPGCRCRNIFRGPGYTSLDMALGKDFGLPSTTYLGEGAKLAIRANFFNIFNILNLSPFIPAAAPTDIINHAQFGHAPDGLAGRVIEFQARLSF